MNKDKCNLCGSRSTRLVHEDNTIGYFKRRIVECTGCGLAFVSPQPSLQQLERLYDSMYKVDLSATSEVDIAAYTGAPRVAYRVEKRIPRIKSIKSSGALLDIGANDGLFVKNALAAGFEVQGIEISPTMAGFASRFSGATITAGTLDNFISDNPSSKFDLITLWDVIEHLLDPMAELKKIHGLLNDGGILAMSTVNRGSLRARLYGDRWLGFSQSPEHTFFFTPDVFCRYVESAGFEVKKVLGWMTPPLLLKFVDLFKMGNVLEIYAVKKG